MVCIAEYPYRPDDTHAQVKIYMTTCLTKASFNFRHHYNKEVKRLHEAVMKCKFGWHKQNNRVLLWSCMTCIHWILWPSINCLQHVHSDDWIALAIMFSTILCNWNWASKFLPQGTAIVQVCLKYCTVVNSITDNGAVCISMYRVTESNKLDIGLRGFCMI